jgi:hypothetical protein
MSRRDYNPHGYQALITDHILNNERCAIWSFMGSGKTVSTYTALDALILAGEQEPKLVVGPLRVARDTWPDEARKWKHLREISVMPIIGSEAERRMALKHDASVYTVNFDNVAWLVEHFGERWPFKTVVWDESTRLSGFRLKQGTQQARAMGRVAHTEVKRFIELTGTPAPNGLQKLWGQMWFLDGGKRLGRTYTNFMERWFAYQRVVNPTTHQPEIKQIILPFAQEQIQNAIRDLCITIDAKDWFDLDEPIVNNVYVELPVKARIKYREMEKDMFTQIEGRDVEAFGAAARTMKCLQLANGAVYVDPVADSDAHIRSKEWREVHDAKLAALDSIVEESNGMPLMVVYEFKSDLARLRKAFPKGVVLGDRDGLAAFKAGHAPMGFAHPASLGHGVDGLQNVTNTIVFFGHNWNLETYMQIIERIGPVRQMQAGFERPVFIYHIIARDTVDELVMARRESKREVQDILLEAMKHRGIR